MSAVACAFTGINGEMIALKDVSISAALRDLLADVTVHQTYRNDEPTKIEAVYTFPLPIDAVLLDFDIHIGNRQLKGTVVEKREAEKSYEDAIESGDTAIMLEQLEPGVYTMNVGNLLPLETVAVTFRTPCSTDGRETDSGSCCQPRSRRVRSLTASASPGAGNILIRREQVLDSD